MTTATRTTQYIANTTYLEFGRIAKLTMRDNNLQHLLNIIANMDDLEVLEILINREA